MKHHPNEQEIDTDQNHIKNVFSFLVAVEKIINGPSSKAKPSAQSLTQAYWNPKVKYQFPQPNGL